MIGKSLEIRDFLTGLRQCRDSVSVVGGFEMAWLRQQSILKEDRPTLEWDPTSSDWLKQVRAEQKAPLENLPPGHPNYVWEFAGPSGIPYPRLPDFALVGTVTDAAGLLPDAGLSAGVSSRIKDAIERLEPGVHQFLPLEIRLPNGEVDKSRWMMVVCNRVDALALDHCSDVHIYRPRPQEHPDWFYYRSNGDSRCDWSSMLIASLAWPSGMTGDFKTSSSARSWADILSIKTCGAIACRQMNSAVQDMLMRFRNNPEWVGVVTEEVDILVYWLNSDLQVGGRKKIELALFSWAALPSAA